MIGKLIVLLFDCLELHTHENTQKCMLISAFSVGASRNKTRTSKVGAISKAQKA